MTPESKRRQKNLSPWEKLIELNQLPAESEADGCLAQQVSEEAGQKLTALHCQIPICAEEG